MLSVAVIVHGVVIDGPNWASRHIGEGVIWWLRGISRHRASGGVSLSGAATHACYVTAGVHGLGTKRNTLVVANLQYSGIVFAALLSLMLFGESIPVIGWVGIVLIVASGAAATALRSRS